MIGRLIAGPATPPPAARQRFQRRRAGRLVAAGLIVSSLAAVGWLLGEPHGPAAIRLFGVGLGWWAGLFAHLIGLVALGFGLKDG